jgi:hypothetical protein
MYHPRAARSIGRRMQAVAAMLLLMLAVCSNAPRASAPTATHVQAPRIREFALPAARSMPVNIVQDPDGALRFTESESNRIGRIAP